MSGDEVDHELLALLRKSLGISVKPASQWAELRVLRDAEYVYDNAVDVAIDSSCTKAAASDIWARICEKGYSSKSWSTHELHPKAKDRTAVNFIFTMDLLNFCFWSDDPRGAPFTVDYHGTKWTGYWGLVAALQRAIEEGVPITSSDFWQDEIECSDQLLRYIFRSSTPGKIPLLEERIACLREAGQILYKRFDCSFLTCIQEAKESAIALVNLLVKNFPCFRDESRFEGRTIRFYKRAQILVADLWACFDGERYGKFHDIDKLTMFADYRIPQMLHSLGCLRYSPPLDYHIRLLREVANGHPWEVQLRGCSIWCVELIRRQIVHQHPEARINAILLDFFLYDTIKEMEAKGLETIPHHHTQSIWY